MKIKTFDSGTVVTTTTPGASVLTGVLNWRYDVLLLEILNIADVNAFTGVAYQIKTHPNADFVTVSTALQTAGTWVLLAASGISTLAALAKASVVLRTWGAYSFNILVTTGAAAATVAQVRGAAREFYA